MNGLLSEETVRLLSKAKNEPEWLLQRRLGALKQFEELPMPQLSYGLHVNASLNINLKELRPQEFITVHTASEAGDASDEVIIEDLSAAAAKYENILRPILDGNAVFNNKLDALHSAFWNNGLFIYAKKAKKAETDTGDAAKIQLQLVQKQTDIVNVVVYAEEGANIDVIEFLTSAGSNVESDNEGENGAVAKTKQYRVEAVDVVAETGANVRFAAVQKLEGNVQSVISRKAAVGGRASIDWIDINLGGLHTRQEIVSMLNGEGATSTTSGAFFGDGSQQLDLMAKAVHNERNTTSNIRIKGALKGSSKAIVQSFTKIMKNATNSEGHQKAHVLLLSESAKASPIPKLEIDNYDVKASHEASVGQLDKDKLFYLMSRGLSEREAVMLVVEGFFEPLIKGIRQHRLEEVAEDLRRTINAKMEDVGEELLKHAEH